MASMRDALLAAHAALDDVVVHDSLGAAAGWQPLEDEGPEQMGEIVRLQTTLEARMAGLGLHVMAAAEACDAKAATGSTDTETWASRAAGRNRDRSWGSLWMAQQLERTYSHVRAALTEGRITQEHARIIVRACEAVATTVTRLRSEAVVRGLTEEQAEALVPGVTREELAFCERTLVDKALVMAPRRLAPAARRVLAPLRRRVEVVLPDAVSVVDPDTGEVVEVTLAAAVADDQTREMERVADLETYLTIAERDDGCFVGSYCLPPLAGQAFRNRLEHLTAPRRAKQRTEDPTSVSSDIEVEPRDGRVRKHHERLGEAFCEILEHLSTDGFLPGTNGATVVVHIDELELRTAIGTATLDTGAQISAGEARRLACNAGIIPLVLSGDSVPLDLGREKRLFSRHQAIALSAKHDTCAAADCERPFAWCELHHLLPWSHAGPTDLANAVPLCGHHHRRIHDPLYHHHLHPDGSISFEHRWPSRRRTSGWANVRYSPAA